MVSILTLSELGFQVSESQKQVMMEHFLCYGLGPQVSTGLFINFTYPLYTVGYFNIKFLIAL
jgi:hypothetical protein